MNEEKNYSYFYWDLPRSNTVYRVTVVILLLILLLTPFGNSPWYIEGSVLEFDHNIKGILIDDHGRMFVQIIEGKTSAAELTEVIKERFGEDAVTTETEKNDQYEIQLGAYR